MRVPVPAPVLDHHGPIVLRPLDQELDGRPLLGRHDSLLEVLAIGDDIVSRAAPSEEAEEPAETTWIWSLPMVPVAVT